MFISESLIYIHMQKTAGSHIVRLLNKFFDGEVVGKHNAATPATLNKNSFVISSIRNPWDWYLSLWTYGVQGNGAFANRLTQKSLLYPLKSSLLNPQETFANFRDERRKDIRQWRQAYADGDNVESFRSWLKLIHDPQNSLLLGEGYGSTVLPERVGIMTHRYLSLCCFNTSELKNPQLVSSDADLKRFDANNCYVHQFIRQENLESDFCDAIEVVRELTDQERAIVFSGQKTNASKRSLEISDYYDPPSVDLVGQREKLLIEKFGYRFDQIAHPSEPVVQLPISSSTNQGAE